MRTLRAILRNRRGIFVTAVLILSTMCFLPSGFALVHDPPAEKPAEPAPAEKTTDLFLSQVETPTSSAVNTSTPDAGTHPEAPIFEAPASSERLLDQFES
jgi:hypothetical protein